MPPSADSSACPAPDFAQRLAGHPGPDDRPWWRLWVSSYAVPAVYTAWRSGILAACDGTRRRLEDVAEAADISPRAARVLLHHLTSLGLLACIDDTFETSAAGRRFDERRAGWPQWLEAHLANPITPARLVDAVAGSSEGDFPEPPPELDAIGRRLIGLPWGFPAAVAADRLGVWHALAGAPEALPAAALADRLSDCGNGTTVTPSSLRWLCEHLEGAGVLAADAGGAYAVTAPFAPFLDPAGCYYKGGTMRLMEMAPASPEQSWDALVRERAATESRMDDTIRSPDLAETYAFALHMDAQGAGADAAWARSGLIRADDRVLDLAGGAGSYSLCGALDHPGARFLLLEQDPMTEVARRWVAQHDVADRVAVAAGDMFALSRLGGSVPAFSPKTVFASNIFHDWQQADNRKIAEEVFETLPDGGRFILHEMPLAEDGFGCDIAAGFSETLRVWTQGMQYRLSELRECLTTAGFSDIETHASLGPFVFIVGTRRAG